MTHLENKTDLDNLVNAVQTGIRLHIAGFPYGLTANEVENVMADNRIAVPVESTRPPLTRNGVIIERAEIGEDLTAIGIEYGMTRERVRQIVATGSTMSNRDIREARKRYRQNVRNVKAETEAQLVRDTAEESPDATITQIAEMTGLSSLTVREALPWPERERRSDQQQYASVSNEDIFAEMRRVANLPGGTPLSGPFYEENRADSLSQSRILQKFGTWVDACEAANVEPRTANAGRVYTRNWNDDQMIKWVWQYLSTEERPSYARFEAWTRTQRNAPSAQTIRNSLGSWVEMKRKAVETHSKEQ